MIRRLGSSPKPASRVRSTISQYVSPASREAVADAVVAGQVRARPRRGRSGSSRPARTRPDRGSGTPPRAPSSPAARSLFASPAGRPARSPGPHSAPWGRRPAARPGARRRAARRRGRSTVVSRRVPPADDPVRGEQSRTFLATGPTWSRLEARATMPKRLTVPYVGRRPTLPQSAEGCLIEPPVSEPSAHGASPADGGRRAPARAARHPLRNPGVVGRPVGRVLGRRAHRELVRVGLPDHRKPRLAPCGDGRVEDRDVAGENLRPGGGLDPLGGDHVLEGDRNAVPLASSTVRSSSELAVPLAHGRQMASVELGARDSFRSTRRVASSTLSRSVSIRGIPLNRGQSRGIIHGRARWRQH